jgi:hypothetical protein
MPIRILITTASRIERPVAGCRKIASKILGGIQMSKDHHAEGEKDGAQGQYNPPHSITPLDTFIHNEHTLDKLEKDNDNYDSGYKNARNQK